MQKFISPQSTALNAIIIFFVLTNCLICDIIEL